MSSPQSIKAALTSAIELLSTTSATPKIDAEVLLCEVLHCNRSKIIADPDFMLSTPQQTRFEEYLQERVAGRPVSYIIGHQGFWSLNLEVNEATLIPRPETELIVELALELPLPENSTCLDLGTGTGAIALAIASEKPGWQVTGCDRITEAVELARRNQQKNSIRNAEFKESYWFSALGEQRFNLIVTNPPYVEANSEYLLQGDLRFEPHSALTSGEDGLDDIKQIIAGACDFLQLNGWLLIEHGFQQAQAIQHLFSQAGFDNIQSKADYAGHDRVTMAQLNVA